MGSSENFCLRWNDFESNVSSSFRELRAEADLFDVSLMADTPSSASHAQKPLKAHKVILSACSAFFKQMLRAQGATNQQMPLIYLRGVRMRDLESVLDFMYHGEVNVAQEDLNSFLAVAEDLQIKGLTQNNGAGSSSNRRPGRKSAAASTPTQAAKRARGASDVVNVKADPDDGGGGGGGGAAPVASTSGTQEQDFDEGDETGLGDYGDDYNVYGEEEGGMIEGAEGTGMEQQDGTKGGVTPKRLRRLFESLDRDENGKAQRAKCLVCQNVFHYSSIHRHIKTVHLAPKEDSSEAGHQDKSVPDPNVPGMPQDPLPPSQ